MKKKYKIILIGAGNVATNIAFSLVLAGHEIVQVYSKTSRSAKQLAEYWNTLYTTDIKNLKNDADLYIISVQDDAIKAIADKIRLGNKVVVHTSGSVPMNDLKKSSVNYGVVYPLQTFSKTRIVKFTDIPLCIEANNKKTEQQLLGLAKQLSKKVYLVNSHKRKTLHLAAVFACNFSNHMYVIAQKMLKKKKWPFDMLMPLIEETVNKIKTNVPDKVQTGPAIRGDKKIMAEHLKMLSGNKSVQKIYELISENIITNKR